MSGLLDPPEGISITKFRLMLWKRYFDTGYGLTSYLKYVVALFGISTLNVEGTMILAFIYAFLCFIAGYLWFRFRLVDIDQEITNRFNGFVREMREFKEKVENNKR